MNRASMCFIFSLNVGLLAAPPIVFAAHPNKAQEIQQAIADKKASQAALAQKSVALSSEVASLKKQLITISRNIRISEEKVSETELNLKNLRQKKNVCLGNLYKDRTALNSLMTAARKYSQTSKPHMLLESNPIDAARAALVMKSMIPHIHQESAYLQSQLTQIEKIESDIAEQQKIQTQQNNKFNKQQADLAVLLEERSKLYQNTETQRRQQEKEVAVLIKESKNLEELMASIKAKSKHIKTARAALPGNILLPVHGNIHIGFGDKDELGAESKGLTFLTRPGAGIIVPLAGTVKFAGSFQNYKQILIVEHQGGYHSLIGGLARIDTVVGAALAAGEPVGVAETSGSPQIYYELRQNGRPVNPQKLLIAQRKQEKS